ncbi:MAG: class I SAM-dependent methyltransferase [Actinomycetota bacterium]|nr:class I SAM-dependent methyltransferase [Actinomycetota bacterium]
MTTETRRVVFGGLTIDHDETVLEPRSWTLLQSDWAVELTGLVPHGRVLELCSGAGHIGLEVVRRSDRDLVQVDISEHACGFARSNAEAAGLGDRVEIRHTGLLSLCDGNDRFPLVLADPPYLQTHHVDRYPSDPVSAIDGGPDGLSLLMDCVTVIDAVLDDEGVALVQVAGLAQAMDVVERLPSTLCAAGVREHDAERAVIALSRPAADPTVGGASAERATGGDRS